MHVASSGLKMTGMSELAEQYSASTKQGNIWVSGQNSHKIILSENTLTILKYLKNHKKFGKIFGIMVINSLTFLLASF